jgi:hypothetical protein
MRAEGLSSATDSVIGLSLRYLELCLFRKLQDDANSRDTSEAYARDFIISVICILKWPQPLWGDEGVGFAQVSHVYPFAVLAVYLLTAFQAFQFIFYPV